MAEEDKQEGTTCHLLQGTVGVGWSLLWWSSLGSTLPNGVRCPINTAQPGWGWWEAWLWSLGLADSTQPPPRLALC